MYEFINIRVAVTSLQPPLSQIVRVVKRKRPPTKDCDNEPDIHRAAHLPLCLSITYKSPHVLIDIALY